MWTIIIRSIGVIMLLLCCTGCDAMIETRAGRIAAALTAMPTVKPVEQMVERSSPTPSPAPTQPAAGSRMASQAARPAIRPGEVITPANMHLLKPAVSLGRGRIGSLALFPKGEYAAIAATRGISIVKISTMNEVLWLESEAILAVRVSPNEQYLAGNATSGKIILWDLAIGQVIREIDAISIAFHPDHQRIALGTANGSIWMEDMLSGANSYFFEGHTDQVLDLVFSPGGETLASACADGSIRLWDVMGRQVQRVLREHHGAVNNLIYSPDGRHILSGAESEKVVLLWETDKGTSILRLEQQLAMRNSFMFLPKTIYFASLGISEKREAVLFYDLLKGTLDRQLYLNINGFFGLAWSDREKALFLANRDGRVATYLRDGTKQASRMLFPTVNEFIAFSTDGTRLMAGAYFLNLAAPENHILDVNQNRTLIHGRHLGGDDGFGVIAYDYSNQVFVLQEFTDSGEKVYNEKRIASGGEDVFLSSNGTYATQADEQLRVWKVKEKNLLPIKLKAPFGTSGDFTGAWFSPDERYLITTQADYSIVLWDAENLKVLKVVKGPSSETTCAKISTDNALLAIGQQNGAVAVYELLSLKEISYQRPHTNRVISLDFAPANTVILSAGRDQKIFGIEPVKDSAPKLLFEKTGGISQAALSPDGRLFVVAKEDGAVEFWSVP